MGERAEFDIALARIRAGAIFREPHRIRPCRRIGRGRPLVRHRVTNFDLSTVYSLCRRNHVARDQVRQRNGIDIEMSGTCIVAVVRILIDAAIAIRDDDQIRVAAITNRNRHATGFGAVLLVGLQRAAVCVAAHQNIVGAKCGVEREIDIVLPTSVGRRRASIDHGEADRRGAARRHMRRNGDMRDLQVGSIAQPDAQGLIVAQGIVAAGRPMLIDTRRTAVGRNDSLIHAL